MSEGKIIEYIDQGRLVCALCIQDKGQRLHLLTLSNRLVNLSEKRATHISVSRIPTERPREELIHRLREIDTARESLKAEINIKELWELIKDENESFDYKYLAQLCFGDDVTDDHVAALVRALFEDQLFFKMKDGHFLPNPEEKIASAIRQMEEERQKEEKLISGSDWLKRSLKEGAIINSDSERYVVDNLIDLALNQREAKEYKFVKELLERAGITDTAEARNILVKLGIWERDEHVDLIRYNIPQSFSDEQIEQAVLLNKKPVSYNGYEDLRHLDVFTVDGADTLDFDDALSIERDGDHMQVGIHITDVSSVIDAGSILDKEALFRASSLYLPGKEIPMFPPQLSHDRLSLKKDHERQALSLLVNFDMNGEIFDYRFVPSIICIKRHLTYDHVNNIYETEKDTIFHWLYRLALKRQRHRVEQGGALILSLPELSISIDKDNSINIGLVRQETPSRMMIAEMMILYNWLAARFCRDNRVPTIYRAQKEPSEKLGLEDGNYIYYVFRQRRKLQPLNIDVEPLPHSGIGLDSYINVTSPIRRYFDLISQRQMLNFMFRGTPFYNREELDRIITQVTAVIKDLNTVKRNRHNYWIIRYLETRAGKPIPAIVLDVLKGRYRVILTDFFITAEIKREKESRLTAGEEIYVRVTKADAWNDILDLEHVRT
ncbi:MAG: RNB domain-containing ribonuclease [Deltaproteobacteria bacterium]|nr:RNB domain-containing ribonuclease [Deltaproteobacteria bacterium]